VLDDPGVGCLTKVEITGVIAFVALALQPLRKRARQVHVQQELHPVAAESGTETSTRSSIASAA
jgi:hypothetical protein